MLDDDALWGSGRARGVDDVGGVARVEADVAARWRAARAIAGLLGVEHGRASARLRRRAAARAAPACVTSTAAPASASMNASRSRGIVRIERQVGAAGLEDAEQPDHHLRRALHAQRHHGLGPDAEAAQVMRQPVGVGVQRGVAQRAVLEQDRRDASGVRAACAANSSGTSRDGTGRGGVVPRPQDGVALGRRRGSTSAPSGRSGVRNRSLQQPDQPRADCRDASPRRTGRWRIPARRRCRPARRRRRAARSARATGRTSRSTSRPAAAAPQAPADPAAPRSAPRSRTPASPGTADAATASAPD